MVQIRANEQTATTVGSDICNAGGCLVQRQLPCRL
jgi:hypothetical protein